MGYRLGVQKDVSIIIFVIILIALAIVASLLAKQCQFFPQCSETNYNPALITGGE